MSYDRMGKAEAQLEKEITTLLEEAENVDDEEDAKYGKGKRGDELPEELQRRESRLTKIRAAKAALEAEAREMAQKNFTDPESRIMKDGASKGFEQAYNAQIVVDSEAQIIVATDLTQESNDKKQLVPMMVKAKENLGSVPENASADAGYFSEANITATELKGFNLHIPPDRQKHGDKALPVDDEEESAGLSVANQMRMKLRTKSGHEVYRFRKAIVEPVFGQIKEARGFRRFSLRGIAKAKAEWTLVCLTHNLLKLFRSGWLPQA